MESKFSIIQALAINLWYNKVTMVYIPDNFSTSAPGTAPQPAPATIATPRQAKRWPWFVVGIGLAIIVYTLFVSIGLHTIAARLLP